MEKEVWLHIATGDKSAYSEMYVFYYKRLFNYGRKFTDDEPLMEDAIQEVLIALWTNREKLPSINAPHTYLFSSFRYTLFRKLKESRKIQQHGEEHEMLPEFAIDHFIVNKEIDAARQQQIQNALADLTQRQREVIFLRFYEGLSYEEVASVMDISVKATYKITARALLQLKENLLLSLFAVGVMLKYIAI